MKPCSSISKSSWISSKLRSDKFKRSCQIVPFWTLFIKYQRNGQHFNYFYLCSLNKILQKIREFLIDATASKLAMKLSVLFQQTKLTRVLFTANASG